MNVEKFHVGLQLLKQPVLPLVSMVEFFFMTGQFPTVAAVIEELPQPIQTSYTSYEQPQTLLRQYLPLLSRFEQSRAGTAPTYRLVSEQNDPVDGLTATSCWISQEILTAELAEINSALCGACHCSLCCSGPDSSMAQEFFEIPLAAGETDHFPELARYNDATTRYHTAMDDKVLLVEQRPFYELAQPGLFHWRTGWSLILPKQTNCPNLNPESGRCAVYAERPAVCRKPQIFPYIIEPLPREHHGQPLYRLRQALLAISDCPYVSALQEAIGDYAAACQLELIVMRNKQ